MNYQDYWINNTNVKCWGCKYFTSGINSIRHCINKMSCIDNDKYRQPDSWATNKIE